MVLEVDAEGVVVVKEVLTEDEKETWEEVVEQD